MALQLEVSYLSYRIGYNKWRSVFHVVYTVVPLLHVIRVKRYSSNEVLACVYHTREKLPATSFILTSNRAVTDWPDIFIDPVIAMLS